MKITGKIDSKIIRQGNKEGKPWERCEITIDKKKYSTFKKEIYSPVNEGDFVEIDLIQNGAYWNISSIKKIAPDSSNAKNEGLNEIVEQLKRIADYFESLNPNKEVNNDNKQEPTD